MRSYANTQKSRRGQKAFPCLMIADDGLVVMFSEPSKGVVLNVGKSTSDAIGDYSAGWAMSEFRVYKGAVTLSNA